METSLILVAIFTGIIALANLILLGALAYLAIAAKKFLDTSVKPTIAHVNSLVGKVESGAERIIDTSENTVQKVSHTITNTADMVQRTIASPLISISSVFAGISEAWKTWRRASTKT